MRQKNGEIVKKQDGFMTLCLMRMKAVDDALILLRSDCEIPLSLRDQVIGGKTAGDEGGVDVFIEGGEAGTAFHGEGEKVEVS